MFLREIIIRFTGFRFFSDLHFVLPVTVNIITILENEMFVQVP
jgi:hypothetical protein